MARPEFLRDDVPPQGSPEAAALAEAAAEVEALADAFVERLRGMAQVQPCSVLRHRLLCSARTCEGVLQVKRQRPAGVAGAASARATPHCRTPASAPASARRRGAA